MLLRKARRVTIGPHATVRPGVPVGHLSQLIGDYLKEREITGRQAAKQAEMTFETLRKILAGQTIRPRDETLQQIADGVGISMAAMVRARAADSGESVADAVVEDITTSRALEIAIARIDEVPPAELEAVRLRAEELLRRMQRAEGGVQQA